MMTVVVIVVVSGALMLGAAWGLWGGLPDAWAGFLVALAGGALMLSAVLELIEPATRQTSEWAAYGVVLVGAATFTGLDHLVNQRLGSDSGAGLLTAITLDGIPENLALGVSLIGAAPMQVAALSGSIFLSNLPEAAGGAKEMRDDHSAGHVFALWTATAVLLSLAAVAGNLLLQDTSTTTLALIRCFAGGAVVASLATEVFPKAFADDSFWTGVATAIGLVLALFLDGLA